MIADGWEEHLGEKSIETAYLYTRLMLLEYLWELTADLDRSSPCPFSPARQEQEMLFLLDACFGPD